MTNGLFVCFRWSQFRDLVDQKKENLNSALGVQNYHLECNETKSWIKEKTKVQNQSASAEGPQKETKQTVQFIINLYIIRTSIYYENSCFS